MKSINDLISILLPIFNKIRDENNFIAESSNYDSKKLGNDNPIVGREYTSNYLTKYELEQQPETKDIGLGWLTSDVLWICIEREEPGYEGGCTQFGITNTGRLCFESQSHCSCNFYEESTINKVTLVDDFSNYIKEVESCYYSKQYTMSQFLHLFVDNLADMLMLHYPEHSSTFNKINKLKYRSLKEIDSFTVAQKL
jgi:hypothetical protein